MSDLLEKGKDSIDQFAKEIKSQVDLISHIKRYEDLDKSLKGPHTTGGHDSKGRLCLSINKRENYWRCFNCDITGDVITFETIRIGGEQQYDGMLSLAEAYNIPLPKLEGLSDEELAEIKQEQDEFKRLKDLQYDYSNLTMQTLKSEHREYLESRGLNSESIEKFRIGYGCPTIGGRLKEKGYTNNELNRSGLFNEGYQILQERIIIPTFNSFYKITHFHGRSTRKDQQPKYLCQHSVRGQNNYAVKKGLWQYGKFTEKLADKKTPKDILICEGAFDALLAAQEFSDEYVVLSPITSQLSWGQIEGLGEMLFKLGQKRNIFICNDNESNKSGLNGAVSTIKRLEKYFIDVITEKFKKENESKEDDKKLNEKDLENFIKANLEEHFNYIMPRCYISILRCPPELDKIDLADMIELGRSKEALYWIKNGITLEQYEQYLIGNPQRFFEKNHQNQSKFSPLFMSNEILREGRYYIDDRDNLNQGLLYGYKDGVYVKPSKTIGEITEGDENIQSVIISKMNSISTAQLHSVVEKIAFLSNSAELIPHINFNDNPTMVNTLNGHIDISKDVHSIEPTSHSPFILSFQQVNVKYDKEKKCTNFIKFIQEVLHPEDIDEAIKAIGYILTRSSKYQKAFFLVGIGGNGKGTFINVLQELCGRKNFSNIGLKDMEKGEYNVAELANKIANFQSDLPPGYMPSGGKFKSVVAGDIISARYIYGSPFTFTPTCSLMFSANEIPKTNDTSYGFLRRWVFFEFSKIFTDKGNENVDLLEELITDDEKSGIFNLAWNGYNLLQKDNGFKESASSQAIAEEYKQQNDPVAHFISRMVVKTDDESNTITKKELYECFKLFSETEHSNRKVESKKGFTFQVRKELRLDDSYEKKVKNTHTWVKIALTPEWDVFEVDAPSDSNDSVGF